MRIRYWVYLSLALYALTGLINIGFIAVDDYYHGIIQYIPAQLRSAQYIIDISGFRSPVPNLFLLGLARLAAGLGIENPSNQLRFINLVLAGLAQISVIACIRHFLLGARAPLKAHVAGFFLAFYFLNPLFFTRPLIEALSAPFLTLSAFYLCAYAYRPRQSYLAFSILLLAVASVFRFQSGICFVAIATVVFLKRRWPHLLTLSLVGFAAFVATGMIDKILKGRFHASLVEYIAFNLEHSSMFGTTPFYSYFLLFIGLSIPPVFFFRYSGFKWKEEYRILFPSLLYFVLFVVAHSAVPHKEERFMVPIIPLFLVLLVPMAVHIWKVLNIRWRVRYFLAINTVLLLLVSFSTVQRNTIALAQHIDRHPEIKTLNGVDETLSVFPRALILRPEFAHHTYSLTDIATQLPADCGTLVAVRYDYLEKLAPTLAQLEKVAEFQPGLPEWVVVKLNPRKNGRRGPISVFGKPGCQKY